MPSLWQMTAFLLNIKVEALFFGRDILLEKRGNLDFLSQHIVQNYYFYIKLTLAPLSHNQKKGWELTQVTPYLYHLFFWDQNQVFFESYAFKLEAKQDAYN